MNTDNIITAKQNVALPWSSSNLTVMTALNDCANINELKLQIAIHISNNHSNNKQLVKVMRGVPELQSY